MTKTNDFYFATEEGRKYFEWLDSLNATTFNKVFIEEWEKLLNMFGKTSEQGVQEQKTKGDRDKIWN